MLITRTSYISKIERTKDLPITKEQFIDWEKGGLAQDVFPDLTADEREFIVSGITPEEWEGLFKAEDDYIEHDCL
jgi:hypothetical protein